MTYDVPQSNFNIGSDAQLLLLLMIAVSLTMIITHSLNTLDIEDKKVPVHTEDSCLSTCVNVYDKRFEQKLSPVRRNRSYTTIDSMV